MCHFYLEGMDLNQCPESFSNYPNDDDYRNKWLITFVIIRQLYFFIKFLCAIH